MRRRGRGAREVAGREWDLWDLWDHWDLWDSGQFLRHAGVPEGVGRANAWRGRTLGGVATGCAGVGGAREVADGSGTYGTYGTTGIYGTRAGFKARRRAEGSGPRERRAREDVRGVATGRAGVGGEPGKWRTRVGPMGLMGPLGLMGLGHGFLRHAGVPEGVGRANAGRGRT
jgi:hypothetical protein